MRVGLKINGREELLGFSKIVCSDGKKQTGHIGEGSSGSTELWSSVTGDSRTC